MYSSQVQLVFTSRTLGVIAGWALLVCLPLRIG